jgi:CRISPR/Cas system CMR-associated protein Cmr5 small subunit
MELKYHKEIETLICDTSNFKEIEKDSFRWTFEDINDIRNFEPIYINNPKRKQENCLGFALSFYISKNEAIKKYKDLTLGKPNLYKKLGTHIANGLLTNTDGIGGDPDEIGHFDFFTYKSANLYDKFTIIESII